MARFYAFSPRARGWMLVIVAALGFCLGATAMPFAGAQLRPTGEGPRAASMSAPVSSSGMIAFTSPSINQSQLLYLIDTQGRSFAIYQVNPNAPSGSKGMLKLGAVRKFAADLQLNEYNNEGLEVAAVESMVKTLQTGKTRQNPR